MAAASGEVLASGDGSLSPSAFRARTRKVYPVPFVRFATV